MARETNKQIKYGDHAITNSITTDDLITIDEDMSLYRIVGNFTFLFQTNAGPHTIQLMIRPGGQSILSPVVPSTGGLLDGTDAYVCLWNYVGYAHSTVQYDIVPFDLKARRKLRTDDTIALRSISSVATNCTVYYSLTFFFLEE